MISDRSTLTKKGFGSMKSHRVIPRLTKEEEPSAS